MGDGHYGAGAPKRSRLCFRISGMLAVSREANLKIEVLRGCGALSDVVQPYSPENHGADTATMELGIEGEALAG